MSNHYIQMASDHTSLELGEVMRDKQEELQTSNSIDVNSQNPIYNVPRRQRFRLERTLLILIFIIVIILLLLLVISIGISYSFNGQLLVWKIKKDADQPCLTFTCLQASVDINKSINESIDPCVDFWQFACGRWINDQILPKGTYRFSTFDAVNDKLFKVQKKLLEFEGNEGQASSSLKAKQFYKSCMDVEKLNELGKEPLINGINKLYGKYGGWEMVKGNVSFSFDEWNITNVVNDPYVMPPFFKLVIHIDKRNTSQNVLVFRLAKLLLEKQYLTSKNVSASESKEIIEAYKEYMRAIGKLLGVDTSTLGQFDDIINLEIEIAQKYPEVEDLRDPDIMYNKIHISNMTTLICPLFDWLGMIKHRVALVNETVKDDFEVIVTSSKHFKAICEIFARYNSDIRNRRVLHNYMIWKYVESNIKFLSEDFLRIIDKFQKVYKGTLGRDERWRICVAKVQDNMAMALGNMYITKHFNKMSKPQVSEMISLMKTRFRQNLLDNKWMDASTIYEAIKKIDAMTTIIGYSEYILNKTYIEKYFSQVDINNDTYFENIRRLKTIELLQSYGRINKPVSNTLKSLAKYHLTISRDFRVGSINNPQEVNAFYSAVTNEIIFPAGILQIPFFDPGFPRSLKYGGIGTAMGHEITHGFDDKGSKFDDNGNLRNWWTNGTRNLFTEKAECFIDQYSKYSIYGQFLNGKNTLGENIADNGGIRLTYQVYKDLEKKFGVENPLPGLKYSHDQLFFLSFSRLWCNLQTKKSTLLDVFSNNHTPNLLRVMGVLSNMKEFAEAFNCPVGSPMNPKKKCIVW